ENRFSVKQFDSTIYPSHGGGRMGLAPEGNSRSYFNDQDRTSPRFEWFTTYALTPPRPHHLLQTTAAPAVRTLQGLSPSRPADLVRADGTLTERIAFVGAGLLSQHRTALRGFAQDSWAVSPRLSLQFGARYDFDSFTSDVNVAPRGSFTVVASRDGRTVVRGGAGVFYDLVPLNVASFDQMQERLVTHFGADGMTPDGPPILMGNRGASAIHTPRSVTWNLELDREWIKNVFVRVGYQQRDNHFEPVLDPSMTSGTATLYLRSDGETRYREGQITARYQFHRTDQIVGSYTRSSAV